jgi:acetyl-CoA acyltransferase
MSQLRDAVIVDGVRTPAGRGKPGGALAGVHPIDLLAGTLDGLVTRNGLDPALVEDVITGCAQQVGSSRATSPATRCWPPAGPSPSPAPRSTGSADPASRPPPSPPRASWPAATTSW